MFKVAAKKTKEQPGHIQTGQFTAGPALAVTLSGNKGSMHSNRLLQSNTECSGKTTNIKKMTQNYSC